MRPTDPINALARDLEEIGDLCRANKIFGHLGSLLLTCDNKVT